jgi:hypothetical protein
MQKNQKNPTTSHEESKKRNKRKSDPIRISMNKE